MAFESTKEVPSSGLQAVDADSDDGQRKSTENGHGNDSSLHDKTGYKGTFETVGDDTFYQPISKHEGRHRYDPKFQWEPSEEKKLVRKVRTQNRKCRRWLADACGKAGLQDLCLGLLNVLCPPTGPRQYNTSLI